MQTHAMLPSMGCSRAVVVLLCDATLLQSIVTAKSSGIQVSGLLLVRLRMLRSSMQWQIDTLPELAMKTAVHGSDIV
jgi:hypothetical protein